MITGLITNPLTATSGNGPGEGDYVGVNTRLGFFNEEETLTYDITINDDDEYEGNETFVVQLVKLNQDTFVEDTLSRCIVTIQDDDCKILNLHCH